MIQPQHPRCVALLRPAAAAGTSPVSCKLASFLPPKHPNAFPPSIKNLAVFAGIYSSIKTTSMQYSEGVVNANKSCYAKCLHVNGSNSS